MKYQRTRILLLATLAAIALACAPGQAQPVITGVNNQTVYADSVAFTVAAAAGYDYLVLLDEQSVPAGTPITVNQPDFHSLVAYRTNRVSGAVESTSRIFIVRASARGDTEVGLPPWVPYPVITSAADEFAGARLRLLVPAQFPQGYEIPIVAWVVDAQDHAVRANGSLTATGHPALPIKRGVGFAFLAGTHPAGPLDYSPAIHGVRTNDTIEIEETTVWTTPPAAISGNVNWDANARVALSANFTIQAGATLTIGAGTIIRVFPGINITNNGALIVNGTLEQPVVFMPNTRSQPWGGFIMRSGTGSIQASGTIFTRSGADQDWFGVNGNPGSHRDEQGLFFVANNQSITLTDCAAIDLAGQLGHAVNGGTFVLTRFLTQRCTTGGEYTGANFTVNDSAFIEFPNDSATYVDQDNDGLYLVSGTQSFTNTLVGWAKDDGIDSGGSSRGNFRYQNCWFESCFHEGNSLSGAGKDVRHFDGVFLNNGQGLEDGYEAPTGRVERCLLIGNLTGARFGDNYNWSYDGFLYATNSILIHNYRDVWGYNWADWTYRIQDMDIQNNFLTVPNPMHPNNAIWNPDTDGFRLAPFRNGVSGKVGVGFATRSFQFDPASLPDSIPVGLSVFSANALSVEYTIVGDGDELEGGTLHFQPGEMLKFIPMPATGLSQYAWAQVRLGNPVQADITGPSSILIVPNLIPSQTLIPFGARWRYSDTGTDRGTVWRTLGYDDATWGEGPAELGNGEGDEATPINLGPSTARFPTTYFRRKFQVDNPSSISGLHLNLRRDDGGIVYLNGTEVFRTPNMPPGTVTYSTLTTSNGDNTPDSANLSDSGLIEGVNLLAVEIHQGSADSSDLSFNLELTANLLPPLNAIPSPGHLVLFWGDASFTLEEVDTLTGTWRPVVGASSPWVVDTVETQRFYRLSK